MDKVVLLIDGQRVEVERGTTILAAAKQIGIKIPTLCNHPDLDVKGMCRVCVVEIKGSRKLECACSTLAENGMEVITSNQRIFKARRLNVELILSSHPTDCLNCIKNQHCELQTLAADLGIRESRFLHITKQGCVDHSSIALNIDSSKCIACGRCVYICNEVQQVGALAFFDRSSSIYASSAPSLFYSPCIKCGQCTSYCPTGAIFEEEHTEEVWRALNDPEIIVVSQIAPAVRVAIGEEFGLEAGRGITKKIYTALRLLGVDYVFDTNFGADLTIVEEASEFVKRFTQQKEKLPLITSCCPSWVDYLEKFSPDMTEHISTAKSPHQMLGVMVKTYWAEKMNIDKKKIFMLSVMPCTAKKYEILRCYDMFASGQQDVDVTLTTRELARMFKQAGIDLLRLPDSEADTPLGIYSGAGVIFGATGGVMEAALRSAYEFITGQNLDKVDFTSVRGLKGVKEAEIKINSQIVKVAVAHGIGNAREVLEKVRKEKEKGNLAYHFIEVMACPGGCVGGGGQPYGGMKVRDMRAQALYQEDRELPVRKSHQNPYIQKLYEEFLGEPLSEKAHKLLHTRYYRRPLYGGDKFSCPDKERLKVSKG